MAGAAYVGMGIGAILRYVHKNVLDGHMWRWDTEHRKILEQVQRETELKQVEFKERSPRSRKWKK